MKFDYEMTHAELDAKYAPPKGEQGRWAWRNRHRFREEQGLGLVEPGPTPGVPAAQNIVLTDTNPKGCRCNDECEFPCWQREGVSGPCEPCGCGESN